MPAFMTQSMSSGVLPVILYYRKQTSPHVSHAKSGEFTTDATNAYATTNNIAASAVVPGTYRSGQGRPRNSNAVLI